MDKKYLVYGLYKCSFCDMAIKTLERRNLQFLFFNLENRQEFLAEVKGYYNFLTVPIILENDINTGLVRFIGGFDDLMEDLGE